MAAVRREEAERFENVRRQARQIYDENKELHREKEELRQERNQLNESLLQMTREKLDFSMLARDYSDRLTDIPMEEVMQHLDYHGERHGQGLVYRGDQNEVAMFIQQQKAFDSQRELICKNSVDLVVYMRREDEGEEGFTQNHALEWLRVEFDEKRAQGAYVANREQFVLDFFERQREERERERSLAHERPDDLWRGQQGRAEDDRRNARDHETHDHETPSFGGR